MLLLNTTYYYLLLLTITYHHFLPFTTTFYLVLIPNYLLTTYCYLLFTTYCYLLLNTTYYYLIFTTTYYLILLNTSYCYLLLTTTSYVRTTYYSLLTDYHRTIYYFFLLSLAFISLPFGFLSLHFLSFCFLGGFSVAPPKKRQRKVHVLRIFFVGFSSPRARSIVKNFSCISFHFDLLVLHFLSFSLFGPSFPVILLSWWLLSGTLPKIAKKNPFPNDFENGFSKPTTQSIVKFFPLFPFIFGFWAFISFHFGLLGLHFLSSCSFRPSFPFILAF